MVSETSLRHALRQATRHGHHAVDRHPLMRPLVDGSLTRESYGRILRGLLGVHQPLQQAFRACHHIPDLSAFADLPLERAALLAHDLETLGAPPAQLPAWAGGLPHSPAQYVGMRYVLEGSVLGAAMLAPRIHAQLGPTAPLAFFGHTAPDTWHRFCCLAETACPASQWDQAIAAAQHLFGDIADWFTRCMDGHGGSC